MRFPESTFPLYRSIPVHVLRAAGSARCGSASHRRGESFLLRMLDKIRSRKYYLVYKNVKDNAKKSRELAHKKEKFIESLSQCYIDRQCIQHEYKAYIDMLISFK